MGHTVTLTDLVAPSFYDLHHDFKAGLHTHYWLKGGRGSTKTSFASIEIVKGVMEDRDANAIILRKVGDTLRDSVYEHYQWAIAALGVEHLWYASVAPLRLIYRPTGQQIRFRGADKPTKIKSAKFMRGYAKYIHYEEVDEFGRMEDIRTINQSLIRGGARTQVIYTFNPPRSSGSWVNKEIDHQKLRKDTVVHHSDYTTVPTEWLGPDFLRDAEHLKATQPERYNHEYLGTITGTGAEVFTNITQRAITEEELAVFPKINRGLDFGFGGHALHYTENYYDKTRGKLYIFYEIHQLQLKTPALVDLIKKQNPQNGIITADPEEPRSIADLGDYGLKVIKAKKGPGSVEHGVNWLQDLNEIVIDPVRCPNTARQFTGYEVERDRNGNLKGSFPDKEDDAIDAVRYSLEEYTRRIKWLV